MEKGKKSYNILGDEIYSDDTTSFKVVTVQQLAECCTNNTIKIPTFQRDILPDKIDVIKSKILANPSTNWLIKQGVITIGAIPSETGTNKYVIDGQHRIYSVLSILKDSGTAEQLWLAQHKVLISIVLFKTAREMEYHFRDLNSGTLVDPYYMCFNDDFSRAKIKQIKDVLRAQYSAAFRGKITKAVDNHNLHLDEFMNKFAIERVGTNSDDAEILISRIHAANEQIRGFLSGLTPSERTKYIKDRDYEKCCETKFYLAYDNIDIVEYVLASSSNVEIHPIYQTRAARKTVPKNMRDLVWQTKCGDKMRAPCFVCGKEISALVFECGHIVSAANGGNNLALSNFEIVCGPCNKSCGTKNLLDFKAEYLLFLST